jgi:hypothetical protein
MVEIVNASIAARASLANTAPTTPAGLAAYLDYVVAVPIEELLFDGDDETQDFVRSLAPAAHGMSGLQPWEGVAVHCDDGKPDPIFAAIETHRDLARAMKPFTRQVSMRKIIGHRMVEWQVPRNIWRSENCIGVRRRSMIRSCNLPATCVAPFRLPRPVSLLFCNTSRNLERKPPQNYGQPGLLDG